MVILPATITTGSYNLLIVADRQQKVDEYDEYNNVASIGLVVRQNTSAQNFTLNVYPNPVAGNKLEVRLADLGTGKAVQLILLNSLGQQVRQQALMLSPSRSSVTFDTASLKKGVYALRLTGEDISVMQRLVIE